MVDRDRAKSSNASKNERAKFDKEMKMAKVAARNGYEVEILKEVPGVSSPDVRINGAPVEFKSTTSHNNIAKYGKKAARKQGASVALFELDKVDDEKMAALKKAQNKVVRVRYYVKGENKIKKPK